MADSEIRGLVNQDSPRSESEGVDIQLKANKRGELCVIDFFTEMAQEGRAFQVRAGSLSAPLVGDVAITDTAAEMCADAASGLTIIPVYCNIALNLGTGTLHEYAVKMVGTASSSGTAFTPLPLYRGGNAAQATARVQAAGSVTVTADAVTTTACLWHVANPLAVGAGHGYTTHVWQPRTPAFCLGDGCVYAQIAATTTGPSYFASLDFIELRTVNVS